MYTTSITNSLWASLAQNLKDVEKKELLYYSSQVTLMFQTLPSWPNIGFSLIFPLVYYLGLNILYPADICNLGLLICSFIFYFL